MFQAAGELRIVHIPQRRIPRQAGRGGQRDVDEIGHLSVPAEEGIAPVAERVEPPPGEAFRLSGLPCVDTAVFPFDVPEEEIDRCARLCRSPGVESLSPRGFRQGPAGAESHAVDAARKEEPSFGVDEVPFPLVPFHPEESGRLEFRPLCPAAVPVPFGESGQGCFRLQFSGGADFLRPVGVPVLPEFVEQREELLPAAQRGRGRVFPVHPEVREAETVVAGEAADDAELLNPAGVDIGSAREAGGHSLRTEQRVESGISAVIQFKGEGALLTRRHDEGAEFGAGAEAEFAADRTFGIQIFDVEGETGEGGKIPVPACSRREIDHRPRAFPGPEFDDRGIFPFRRDSDEFFRNRPGGRRIPENRFRREVECGEKSGGEKHLESHFDGSHSQVNFPARR